MKVEVDLSNRLEEPGPTYLAFSNSLAYVIKIPVKVKKVGFALLEARGTTKKKIRSVTKKSSAHGLVWTAFRRSKAVDKVVTEKEMAEILA